MLSQPILRGSDTDTRSIEIKGKTYDVISDSEKINFEAHGYFDKSFFAGSYHTNVNYARDLVSLMVNRNFVDDTFSLKTKKFPANNIGYVALSANNKTTAWEGAAAIQEYDYITAKPFALENETFLKSSSWTSSYAPKDDITKAQYVFSVFPHITPLSPNFLLHKNQVLKLNLIKDIKFALNADLPIANAGDKVPIAASSLNPTVDYASIYVVPRNIDQLTHRITIADLYLESNYTDSNYSIIDKANVSHFFTFANDIKYKSSSFTGDLKAIYKEDMGNQFYASQTNSSVISRKFIKKLASLDAIESTAYNYENSKTEISQGGDAQMGELLPFNFKGNYSNNFTLGLSSILKNINVSTSEYIDQAILDPYSGKVQLNITPGEGQEVKLFKLDTKQVKDFRAALTEQKFIELEGIRRFSNE